MIARSILVAIMLAGGIASVATGCWWLAPWVAMVFMGFCFFLLAVGLVVADDRKGRNKK